MNENLEKIGNQPQDSLENINRKRISIKEAVITIIQTF